MLLLIFTLLFIGDGYQRCFPLNGCTYDEDCILNITRCDTDNGICICGDGSLPDNSKNISNNKSANNRLVSDPTNVHNLNHIL